ncbi:hypothetical protein THRCLA_12213 [Thraustotheca clavata]|uniref:Uncharacterized protein n=1 Tax=Thraustotheca clavata TaxID=74557 RepID=A0A1W0A1Y9_9STRA|nr:hypothetical protein THRCLA_12213 [Thraustotheca clavata]
MTKHKHKRRDDSSLPVLKREQIMGMLQELNQRQAARGYQTNDKFAYDRNLLMKSKRAEEQEKAQSISHFLSIRYHDIYGEHLDGSVNNAVEAKPSSDVSTRKGRIKRSQSISEINHLSTTRRPTMGASVSSVQLAPIVKPEVVDVKEVVKTPVDRQLPPLYHKMKAIWKLPLTGKPSEEELLGLPISEHTVRNVLCIDVYEAHGIAKAFVVGTVESLYQLYTKERIHGREGHMREQMQKAVFSSVTCNRVMNILKQIDAFSIFLDSRQEENVPVPQTITIVEENKSVPKPQSHTPEPTLSTQTDCNGRHLSIATASLLFLPPIPLPAKNRNDMINVYLEGCAQHHVFPSKKVIALLDTKTINLSHFHLGKLGTMAMLSALEFNHFLESLDVSNNFLMDAGERNSSSNLSHLSLAKNHIGTAMAARLLLALARSNCPLKSLTLSANEIYDRNIGEPLKAFLSSRLALTSLDLSDNKLRDSSAKAITSFLSQESKLRMLNLGWNSITPDAASDMIRAVATNKTLESLNLSWNRLGHSTGCAAAIALLRNQTLRDLDISSGQLSAQSVFFIADALHYNHGLSHFRLDQNYITDDGMKVLLRATKRRSKLLPLQLSLQNMVYETNDCEHLRYDPLNPSGFYELDFAKPGDRCIYELLRLRIGQGMGTLNNIHVNDTPIDSMRRLERSVANGQTIIQFHYVAVQKQTRSELVHFRLDLSQSHDRTMVQFLMLRANSEQGENWYNETLDGVPFQFDESAQGTEWLALHPKGLLEFDYASTKLFCERHYRLDLSISTDRAVVWKILERLQRSHQIQDKVNSQPDELKNLTLDGDEIALSDLENSASMSSRTKWKWRVPSFGILEFDFYTPKPHQIYAKHYVLDLSNASDRHTAHELRLRSFKSVGECWWNERIDGYPFHLSENSDAAFEFSRKGILELDFLVLRPAHYITSMSMDELTFDLSQFDVFLKAELLRRLTIAEPHDYLWTNVEINKKVYVRHDEMLPAQGNLTCSAIIFHGLAEPASAENFNFFLEQLNQARDDPDRQKYIVRMACSNKNSEELVDEQDSLFFTSSMIDTVLMQIEAEKHQQQIFELLYPNIIDKAHAMDLAINYKSQAIMDFLGIESFEEFQAMCIKTYLHTRFNPRNI